MAIYAGDQKISKICLGDKVIMEAGGGVTFYTVESAISAQDAGTLHVLYQTDPKKKIIASDEAIHLLEAAYPESYSFVHAPGINLDRFDLPEAITYLGAFDCSIFGKFIGGTQDGKEFGGDTLGSQLALPGDTQSDGGMWHAFYTDHKIMYICDDTIRCNLSWVQINNAGCIDGKASIVTTSGTLEVRTLTTQEWDIYLRGLHNGIFASLDGMSLGFGTFGYGYRNWTNTLSSHTNNDWRYYLRYGDDGEMSTDVSSTFADDTCGWRPVLIFTIS